MSKKTSKYRSIIGRFGVLNGLAIAHSLSTLGVLSPKWGAKSKVIKHHTLAHVYMLIITLSPKVPNNIYILILQRYKRVALYKQGVCAAGYGALTVQPPNLAGLSLFRT